MSRMIQSVFVCVALMVAVAAAWAQDDDLVRITVEFSDPDRAGLLRMNLIYATVLVSGYDGEAVLVETSGGGGEASLEPPPPPPGPGGQRGRGPGRGPRPQTFRAVERNNVITITSGIIGQMVEIQVPRETSLSLNGAVGDIVIEGIAGRRVTVNTQAGNVELRDVTGSVAVHSLAGNLTVSFPSGRVGEMEGVTLNGTIDVSIPEDADATLRLENRFGSVESEFELEELTAGRPPPRRGPPPRSVSVADINRGGPTLLFQNTLGDIVVRRSP